MQGPIRYGNLISDAEYPLPVFVHTNTRTDELIKSVKFCTQYSNGD